MAREPFKKWKPRDLPCHYCNRIMVADDPLLTPTRDHVLPKAIGGRGRNRMVVWCCFACNNLKGDMHPDFWEAIITTVPEWWRLAERKGPRGINLWLAFRDGNALPVDDDLL